MATEANNYIITDKGYML